MGTRVSANQYASDTISLQKIVQDVYKGIEPKPLIIAPGGFFDAKWFTEFVNKTTKILDVATHHIYNLGPGTFKMNNQIFVSLNSQVFLKKIELLKIYVLSRRG